MEEHRKLGELLLEKGYIKKEELEEALEIQAMTSKRLGRILCEKNFIKEQDLFEFLAYQANVPFVRLSTYPVMRPALELINKNLAAKYNIFPFLLDSDTLYIAVDDPYDIVAIDDLQQLINKKITPVLATPSEIKHALKKYYEEETIDDSKIHIIKEKTIVDELEPELVDFKHDKSEIANVLEKILIQAIKEQANFIYIEPRQWRVFIRVRIDGVLRNKMALPKKIHSALISKIKSLSESKIKSEHEKKDKESLLKIIYEDETILLKIKIINSVFGETGCIQIKRKQFIIKEISSLGMEMDDLETFEKLLNKPRGLLICSGPMSSGKSTSIYSILNTLYSKDTNIITVEDSPEYEIDRFTQIVAGSEDKEYSKKIIQALELKPDILMISKIGDELTTKNALYATAQGKYIITSYYADSCVDTIYHLMNSSNIDRYQLAFSLNGVINQRLLKLLCPYCKYEKKATSIELNRLGLDASKEYIFYESKGCNFCENTGFSGLTGIFQILVISNEMKKMILENASYEDLIGRAVKDGMKLLRKCGLNKVLSGHISAKELLKNTFREDAFF